MGAPARIVCVGAADPEGGGGVHMDVAVARALSAEPVAVTVMDCTQDEAGLAEIALRDPEEVGAALLRALEGGADAVKTGALGDAAQVEMVAEILEPWHEQVPVVVDPVARARRVARPGLRLLTDAGVEALRARLLPLARVATPIAAEYDERAYRAPVAVLQQGAEAGSPDEDGPVVDRFSSRLEDAEDLRHPRVAGAADVHGSRSALATAIACFLARGVSPRHACERAAHVVNRWLESAARRHDRRLVPASWDDRGEAGAADADS